MPLKVDAQAKNLDAQQKRWTLKQKSGCSSKKVDPLAIKWTLKQKTKRLKIDAKAKNAMNACPKN